MSSCECSWKYLESVMPREAFYNKHKSFYSEFYFYCGFQIILTISFQRKAVVIRQSKKYVRSTQGNNSQEIIGS